MAHQFEVRPSTGLKIGTQTHGGIQLLTIPGAPGAFAFEYQGDGGYALTAVAAGNNDWMTGSTPGDMVIRTTGQNNIIFGNDGTLGSVLMKISTEGLEITVPPSSAAPNPSELVPLQIDPSTGKVYR